MHRALGVGVSGGGEPHLTYLLPLGPSAELGTSQGLIPACSGVPRVQGRTDEECQPCCAAGRVRFLLCK